KVGQHVGRVDDHAEPLSAEPNGVVHEHTRQDDEIGFDSSRLGENNFSRADAVVGRGKRITLARKPERAPHKKINFMPDQCSGGEIAMRETAATATNFIA